MRYPLHRADREEVPLNRRFARMLLYPVVFVVLALVATFLVGFAVGAGCEGAGVGANDRSER